MKKRIKKFLMTLTSLALVFGSVNYSALAVQAADVSTKYYTFNDVSAASVGSGSWGVTKDVSDSGALSATYSSQYAETQYTLPEGVDPATLEKISFDISAGDTSVFAIKIYADGSQVDVNYGVTSLDVTADLSSAESVVFGLMSTSTDVQDFVVDYFTITAEQTGGSDSVPSVDVGNTAVTKYYTFNDITAYEGYGYTAKVSDAGAVDLAFSSQYMEVKYTLPNGVDGNSLKSITFNLSEGDVSNLCIKIYADGSQVQAEYEKNTISVSADLSAAEEVTFALMNKGNNAADFVIDYFTIKALQTGGSDSVPSADSTNIVSAKYYTFNDVTKYEYYGCTDTVSSAGAVDLAYEGQYQEVKYNLPSGVDGNSLKSIEFDVSEGDLSNLCIKIYADGNQVQAEYEKDTINVTADLSGAEVISFGLMNNGEEAADFHMNYIKIKALQTGGSATVPSVEEPEESDPVVVDPVEAFVTRMYQQCLDREPDQSGLDGWVGQLKGNYMDGAAIAEQFVFSNEMLSKNLSNEEFVTVLYRAMMGREADEAGLDGWVSQLEGKYMTRSEVTKSFVESTEFTEICTSYGITRGTYDASIAPIEHFVTRFYTLCLERNADQAGLYGWVGNLKNQYMNGAQIANSFFFSTEFTDKNVSDDKYVELLYNTLMGRASDENGKAGWVSQLEGNFMSRMDMMKAFIESDEFTGICESYDITRGSL